MRHKPGAFDYLLEPLRDDVWNEPPVRDYAPAIPPPPPKPLRPPKVTVNIEIVHTRPNKQPRQGLSNAVIVWIIAFGLILLAMSSGHTQANGPMRYEHWQSTDGSHGEVKRQGRTTDWTDYGPRGEVRRCHQYYVGDQAITSCN